MLQDRYKAEIIVTIMPKQPNIAPVTIMNELERARCALMAEIHINEIIPFIYTPEGEAEIEIGIRLHLKERINGPEPDPES